MDISKAKVFAASIDSETRRQFHSCARQPYVSAAALMPDAHLGYAAPIGAVLATKGVVVPSWVGFDIGCGVLAMKLDGKNLLVLLQRNAKRVHSAVSRAIPLGKGQKNSKGMLSEGSQSEFISMLDSFRRQPHDRQVLNLIKTMGLTQLGTLGGGNHFIELDFYGEEVWIVVHSGSRGLGHKIAAHYMRLASKGKSESIEETAPLSIGSKEGIEYMAAHDFCLKFAMLNRQEMANRVVSVLEKLLKVKIKKEIWVNNNHNHVVRQKSLLIHRKGATPAAKNERGVVPANMRDGSLLVIGQGSGKFLFSSSHGAGRVMSRRKAKETFSAEDLAASMQGITSSIEPSIIDEIPMAYKDIDTVMAAQKESVKVVKHLRPLVNWKGTETSYLD